MEETITPYELPDEQNHSLFFVDVRIPPALEAPLHRHDAWELTFVTRGRGRRMAGDALQSFAEGDVVLIPPSMLHRWEYDPAQADPSGHVRYLMVAFRHSLVEQCIETFPEIRNRLSGIAFPREALRFGAESARPIRRALVEMNGADEPGRLCRLLGLLPLLFTAADCTSAGRAVRIERDVKRMQQVCTYVMRHYASRITLDEIAAEMCMNRSAFCSWFRRCRGTTFFDYLNDYRIDTACELLATTSLPVSGICFSVGFGDTPHFNRMFRKRKGVSPGTYRTERRRQRG
ncbi:AraC family transcriptional regulator [Alistipes sp.]|uniref:helix-turn-helix transcriptional regulator n=1 Tax=Alistipes sp. TaxID=1872444 RepID=UPI003AF0EB58